MSLLNFTFVLCSSKKKKKIYVCTHFYFAILSIICPFFFPFFNGEALIAYKSKINIELRVFLYCFDNLIVEMGETNLNLRCLPSKYQKISTN